MLQAAEAQYRLQVRLALSAASVARTAWARIVFGDLDGSWPALRTRALAGIIAAQQLATHAAGDYVTAALAAQDLHLDQEYSPNVAALVGIASDGRPLDTLLDQSVVHTKARIAQGSTPAEALATGRDFLTMAALTQVRDAGRVATGLQVHSRPRSGYTRMLQPPSCSRCVVLAGKYFKNNTGFQRHPRCDCIHVPTVEDVAGDLTTDPGAYFESLPKAEQDRTFTNAGAEAIRDGADINQVVNARRGALGMAPAGGRLTAAEQRMLRGGLDRGRLQSTKVFGQDVFTTTEGTTRRGVAGQRLGARSGFAGEQAETVTRLTSSGAQERVVTRQRAKTPRLMPESIYEIAKDRDEAIRLLRRFGYIL